MDRSRFRAILVPLGLLGLSDGAYWSALMGVVPFGLETPLVFAAIAGTTALGAVTISARAPAVTAGVAAVGFTLAAPRVGEVLGLGDPPVLVGAALATLGVLSYAVSMLYHVGTRVHSGSPA
jgi:hypothetical protein